MPSEYIKFRNLLTAQLLGYPLLEIQDIYKLIYQASMGSEHAILDVNATRARMGEEVRNLDHEINWPRYENISPVDRIFRIHLGPFRENDFELDAINESFIQTAKSYDGSIAILRRYWFYIEQMAAAGRLPFELFQLRHFFGTQEDSQFPTVHHSNRYRSAYKPAYRIVAREFLPGFIAADVLSSTDK